MNRKELLEDIEKQISDTDKEIDRLNKHKKKLRTMYSDLTIETNFPEFKSERFINLLKRVKAVLFIEGRMDTTDIAIPWSGYEYIFDKKRMWVRHAGDSDYGHTFNDFGKYGDNKCPDLKYIWKLYETETEEEFFSICDENKIEDNEIIASLLTIKNIL